VVALVMTQNASARRAAEDALARELTALCAQGVAAYTLLPDAQAKDEAAAKAALSASGAVGVVVMRPVAREQEVSSTPSTMYMGPRYRGFWGGGDYGDGWVKDDAQVPRPASRAGQACGMLRWWSRRSGPSYHVPVEEVCMRKIIVVSALALVVAFAAACSSQKVPAESALKAAETAWASVSAEASRVVPDQAKEIEAAISSAKDAMTKGNFEAVIEGAGAIPARIADVEKAIADRKSEWDASWRTLDSVLGSWLTAVQTKVDELSAARRLPAGVNKAAVAEANTALTTAQQTYADAKAAFGNGNFDAALAKANEIQTGLTKVMTDLKLEMPVAADVGNALTEAATKSITREAKK
jgi:hypothetical protein